MKVKLKRTHEHDGVQYEPGDIIETSDDIAKWLIANRVAVAFSELSGSEQKEKPKRR